MMTNTRFARTEVAAGCIAEYEQLATLIESLDASEWDAPSRCDGWQVSHVAGHVTGLAEDAAAGVPGSRTADEEAASLRGLPPAEVAQRLRAATTTIAALLEVVDDEAWAAPLPALPDLTLGYGVLTIWYDTFVHADDIRAATGRSSDRTGAGVRASVEYLASELCTRDWGPAVLTLDGLVPHEIGSGGREIEGDPMTFVLVATGRANPSLLGLDDSVNIYRT
jgi:uncharacterized protein (TIGR03083 family)